jgi:NAD-dependent deacetylase
MEEQIEQARALVAGAQRVVVLTGAGISTDSGIADFRGPQGLWTKDPEAERASHIDVYRTEPEVRRRAWATRAAATSAAPEPNEGHRALVRFEATGRLRALLTQNVDGLHLAAGSDPDLVVEVHGTVREAACLGCGDRLPMATALERVRAGEADPACTACGGILKSATISFGQGLDPDVLQRADAAARASDLLLAVGTTLAVHPIAEVVPLARAHGAAVVILNGEPTAMDDLADVVVRGPISDVLPRLLGGRPAGPPL